MKTLDEFNQELLKRFPNNKIEILEYNGAMAPIKYRCIECNSIYKKTRANHLYENKTLCQKCYSSRESEIRHKFNYVLNKSNFINITKIGAISKPVQIKCKSCGRVKDVLQYNVIKEGKINCPNCGKFGEKTIEDFYSRMGEKIKDYEVIEYKNYTTKALFKHTCGFIFSQLPQNFIKGRGCPKCYKKISKGEQFIMNWLNNNNIEYEFQKKFQDLSRKSFDFFLPKQKILIEYQGEQHYRPLPYFGGEEKFKQQIKRDLEKKEYCKRNNYTLIEIPYYESDIEKLLLPLKGSTTIYVDSSESKEN